MIAVLCVCKGGLSYENYNKKQCPNYQTRRKDDAQNNTIRVRMIPIGSRDQMEYPRLRNRKARTISTTTNPKGFRGRTEKNTRTKMKGRVNTLP